MGLPHVELPALLALVALARRAARLFPDAPGVLRPLVEVEAVRGAAVRVLRVCAFVGPAGGGRRGRGRGEGGSGWAALVLRLDRGDGLVEGVEETHLSSTVLDCLQSSGHLSCPSSSSKAF